MIALRRLLARAGLTLAVLACGAASAQDVTVFAAASMTNLAEDIGKLYRESGGTPVRFSFAASSTLARQIGAGAPAAIFISADEQWMDWLQQRKLVVASRRRVVAGNALVLVVPATHPATVELKPGFDLAALLGRDGRLATGDPAHVPVGRYAQEALTRLGVWSIAERRLVRADSVRAALVLVERSEVPAGIVYSTDAAITPKVRVAGTFPASTHTPIVYPAAIVTGQDSPAARRFFAFLTDERTQALYRKYGFTLPIR